MGLYHASGNMRSRDRSRIMAPRYSIIVFRLDEGEPVGSREHRVPSNFPISPRIFDACETGCAAICQKGHIRTLGTSYLFKIFKLILTVLTVSRLRVSLLELSLQDGLG